jgi:hypothetical protein
MDQEIGRIKKSDKKDIVLRLDEFNGKEGITIREFIRCKRYTGYTKSGTRIPKERWPEFKELVNKVPA